VLRARHRKNGRRALNAFCLAAGIEALSKMLERDVELGRYAATNRRRRALGKPETFNFLLYLHLRKIATGALPDSPQDPATAHAGKAPGDQELRRRMHQRIREAGAMAQTNRRWVLSILRRPDQQPGPRTVPVPSDDPMEGLLSRRSQKGRRTRVWMAMLADYWLPQPRILSRM
jgi:RNA-directed DNA polymerase